MSKDKHPPKLIGQRVRIKGEGEVVGQYEAGPTAPERVQIRIAGVITVVPVASVEVVE